MTQIVPKKLQKIGGSSGFIVPKRYMKLLGWDSKTRLIFFVVDGTLHAKKYEPPRPYSQTKDDSE